MRILKEVRTINFSKEVVPFIKQYMNIVFRAYDGYGASIVYPNGLSIDWDIDDKNNIVKVTLESENYKIEGENEEFFSDALSIAKMFVKMEIQYMEHRRKIDQQYKELIKKIQIS